jgi:hypothetical protein
MFIPYHLLQALGKHGVCMALLCTPPLRSEIVRRPFPQGCILIWLPDKPRLVKEDHQQKTGPLNVRSPGGNVECPLKRSPWGLVLFHRPPPLEKAFNLLMAGSLGFLLIPSLPPCPHALPSALSCFQKRIKAIRREAPAL